MLAERAGTPWCFVLNSGAIGDIIACLPALKFAVEKIWNQPDSIYTVITHEYFKPLLHFIPEKHIKLLGTEIRLEVPHSMVYLNDTFDSPSGPTAITTPLRMSLVDYAAIKLLGTLLGPDEKDYPLMPVNGVTINRFNLPKRYVCICATEVNKNRALPFEEIEKVTDYLLSVGITPVYLGKSVRVVDTHGCAKEYGDAPSAKKGVIDLVDKTTIMEAAKILSKAECVIGADTGLIHLAALSDVKIICSYTTVKPEIRMPTRHSVLGWNVIALEPEKDGCRYCQSNWWLNGWNFNNCLDQDSFHCLTSTQSDKIIAALMLPSAAPK